VERSPPRPSDAAYVEARLLEALGEARLALEYLERDLTRNAAGKAFQAWKALLAALLRLELERLKALARTEEEKRRLESKAVPRVPSAKMKELSRLLREVGHEGITFVTDKALDLHDYQYNGPDPDMALSKCTTRESAAADVVELIQELVKRVEALGEARLALEFLERGLTRNAAGKAFQAWKALLAALLRLELERLKVLAKTEEERRWLESKAVPRVPTTEMKELSRLLRDVGHEGITFVTDKALDLHEYQYHGPDPDMALSKYTTRESAAADVVELIQELVRRVEALRGRLKWTEEIEKALEEVKRALEGF
jgi:thermostable 8-oxoguanine DNA glycosylase